MKVELKWVVIIFIVHLLWHVTEKLLGFYTTNIEYTDYSGFVFMPVYAGLMYLALVDLRKSNHNLLNRRHAFLSGLFISLCLVVLAPVMVFLVVFLLQPDFFQNMIAYGVNSGKYSSYGQAATEFSYWGFVKLYMAIYMLVGSLSAALWGFVLHKMPDPVTE